MSTEKVLAFGGYRFLVTQRLLMVRERPVQIGNRAGEILAVLLEHAGEVVRKRVLMERVWSSTCVEEGTLRVHMTRLRRILGKDRSVARYVETVTGIGYRFAAPLEVQSLSLKPGAMHADQHPLLQIEEYLQKKNVMIVLDNSRRMISPWVRATALRGTCK
ncbi:MAG: winged helix-turn-helix domain-containing protein [Gammaproteobacteria bacterium]